MCYDADARPPLPPIRGAALDSGEVTLTSADGTLVAAYAARPAAPSGAGIVILPDVRGLHPFFEELALRFAEAGVDAIAIDYFSRTAGTGRRGADFDYPDHVGKTTPAAVQADVAAAVSRLRGLGCTAIFTVGFCFGGRLSYLQAASGIDAAGVIGFYGPPVGPNMAGLPAPADEASRFTCPVLEFWGGSDRGIGAEVVQAFNHALDRAGVPHTSVSYPGAPHSFFDRHADEHAEASADAWRQMLDFMKVSEAAKA